jgi:eukaryotic-like serine/threonine-protein kinase
LNTGALSGDRRAVGEPVSGDDPSDELSRTRTLDRGNLRNPASEAVIDDRDPARLGRFLIRGRLGRGGMGVVYEAVDPDSGERVAIKTLQALGPERLYRFKREFRALAGIQHANVVVLHELASEDDYLFFTMELVRGVDFVHAMCGPPRLDGSHAPCTDYKRLRDAMRQLAAGVHAIHGAGILHRDIKPSNVLVTAGNRVVLLDFGLVREHGVQDQVGVTAHGVMLGTPLYMAPEQTGSAEVGPAADWYAVGGLLYQALTGRPPYRGLGVLGMLAAKQEAPPEPPSARGLAVPIELEQLCLALLQPDPATRPVGADVVRAFGASSVDEPRVDDAAGRFLGRAAELALLDEALAATAEGGPGVVVVEGASGIGKTALVQRFARDAERAGATVLSGKCSERESIPYKALDSVMDLLAVRLGADDHPFAVQELLPRDVHSVARLFPVLNGVSAIAIAPGRRETGADPVELRRRGFAALAELFARIADRRRLVVHIDDFQWSDVDSASLLSAVLRHPDPPALLLVLGVREGADAAGSPLRSLLDELADHPRAGAVRRLALGPLPVADAEALAAELLGVKAGERGLAEGIVRESEGSPFFVGELVRYAKLARPEGADAGESSVKLGNVIRHRVRRLPAAARHVLSVCAVAGGRLPQRIALQLAAEHAADASTIQRLRTEHLARTHGPDPDDTLEIDHDRIRVGVLAELGDDELPRMHLAIARALAKAGLADEHALSHHFRAAGEAQLACVHTLAAAEQAAGALAFDRAAELYRAALALGVLPTDESASVQARLAEALADAGRSYDAAQAWLAAAAHDDGERALEWRRRAAEHLLSAGYTDEGRVALARVLRAVGLDLPRSMPGAIATLLVQRARISWRGLDVEPKEDTVLAASDRARLDACWTASRGLVYTDGLVGATFHARHLQLALALREPSRMARALAFEGHFAASLGAERSHERARKLVDRAQVIADAIDSDYARGMVAECSGHIAMGIGDWRTSFAEFERALAIFRERCTGVAHEVAICRAHGALCLQYLGRVDELRTRAYELLEENRERANPYAVGFARGILGNMALLATDRIDEAAEHLAIYRQDAPARFEAHKINLVAQTAALERYRGRPERAWEVAQADAPLVAKLAMRNIPQASAEIHLWRGQCALAGATVRPDRARLRLVEQAADKLARHPTVFGRAYAELLRGSLHALLGRTDDAIHCLRAALEGLDARGMVPFSASARLRLAVLVGGDEGRALAARGDADMTTMGVVRPDRFIDMMMPGFVS